MKSLCNKAIQYTKSNLGQNWVNDFLFNKIALE